MKIRDDDLNNVAGGAGSNNMVWYTVVKDDNLHRVARNYQQQGYNGVTWEKIFDWNRDTVKNPDFIDVGWRLRIYLIK